jgi:ankyrin repeat protein
MISSANNNTAVQYAAQSGNVHIMKLLLDNGLSVNLNNSNDSSSLHISAVFGHLEATKFVVGRGAAINNTDMVTLHLWWWHRKLISNNMLPHK